MVFEADELEEAPPPASLEVIERPADAILSRNESPDVPFRWSVNPYRGCYHACWYCYARPGHEYLGMGAGTDFETRLRVKPNAAERLDAELRRRARGGSWSGELIAFSGETDCYQPLEASYQLTRQCLEVCRRFRNPVGVITKSRLVTRDADVLAALADEAYAGVSISCAFAPGAEGDRLARIVEPYASTPTQRMAAVRALADAGVPVGVLAAPIIPGLNDHQLPAVLRAAADAGAQWAGTLLLRLPGSVRPVFLERLAAQLPERAPRVIARLRELRGGKLSDPRFGHRHRGQGPWWDLIRQVLDKTRRRLGLAGGPPPLPTPSPFRVPPPGRQAGQLSLFDEATWPG